MTRGEGRRSYSAEDKVRLVAETLAPGETVEGVSRRHGVCASLLHRWRRAARGEAPRRRAPAPRLLPVRLVAPPGTPSAPAPLATSGGGFAGPVRGGRDPTSSVEVVLRNGRVLRIGMDADVAAVARLAAALEA